MFRLAQIVDCQYINLKCDPDKVVELKECYQEVMSAYHMNKKNIGILLELAPYCPTS